MSWIRAAPGPQLAAGRLRVDAARAIAKLREYQLADRTAWVLEAIRAAVAAGATAIELRGDSNDVWLAWHGTPLATEDLPKLFDELVSPEPSSDRHHVRLLAAAVNSGLGLDPAYIDVFAIDAAGAAVRARYTPDVLDAPDTDANDLAIADAPLRHVLATPVPAPPNAAAGMIVHLRRRASLEVLAYFLQGSEPPELALARHACRDIAVPLRIGDEDFDRRTAARDIVRIPLGDGFDGFVAVTDPAPFGTVDRVATMEVAERGVVLAVYPLQLGLGEPRGPQPLRLYIDAPRMPTNASRSQVRLDGHPIAGAIQRAIALLPALFDALAVELAGPTLPQRARTAALAIIASSVAGPDWSSAAAALRGPLRALADLLLVRTATGTPRRVAATWAVEVHTGSKPLDADLAPWLDNVLWMPPGDAVSRLTLLTAHDPRAMRRRARWARRQRRAHRRFFGHDARPASVVARSAPWMRANLGASLDGSCVANDAFIGFTGEICVFASEPPARAGDRRQTSELVVLLQGREIERIELDSPIVFAAVIDAQKLSPADRYRGVHRDREFTRLDRAMRAGVLRAAEALAHALGGGALPRGYTLTAPMTAPATSAGDRDARLIRGALALARELHAPIRPPLSTAPAWRTVDDAWVSLADLIGHHTIGIAPSDEPVRAPTGRLVVYGDHEDRQLLARLRPTLSIVDYRASRSRRANPHELADGLASTRGIALAIRDGDLVGAIAFGTPSIVRFLHAGVQLGSRPLSPQVASCVIEVDSDAIVPDAAWEGILWADGLDTRDFREWELALVRAVARDVIGERDGDLRGRRTIKLTDDIGRTLCTVLGKLAPDDVLGPELAARMRACPLFELHGELDIRSVDEIAARFPDTIPYFESHAEPIAGFTPLLADETTARAVAALSGRELLNCTITYEARKRAAARKTRLDAHRARPASPPALPYATESVAIATTNARGLVGVSNGPLEIHVAVEGRPFCVLSPRDGLPVVAALELAATAIDDDFRKVPELLVATLIEEVYAQLPELLIAIARTRPHDLADPGPTRALLAAWLRRGPPSGKARYALCAAVAFPTIQGPRSSLEVARDPRHVLSTASWHDSWLGAEPDPRTGYDEPVIQITDRGGDLAVILEALHSGVVVDVTDEVVKLQSRRRMARGLLPIPKLKGVPAELKRALTDLGAVGRRLGIGEIGLVETGPSFALLHVHGEPRDRVQIDVLPAVHLAIEAPELIGAALDPSASALAQIKVLDVGAQRSSLSGPAQQVAVSLVRALVTAPEPPALTAPIRRNLARALLAGRLDAHELVALAVFETIDNRWVDVAALAGQRAMFGDIWYVPGRPLDITPLDDNRLVLRLEVATAADARSQNTPVVDATRELTLDAVARRNRARADATSLDLGGFDLDSRDDLLATIPLGGDGVTGPRGTVGVLNPRAAERRGVRPHRAMHPFEAVGDPCLWPTIATIDDARLTPDRTWERPALAGAWPSIAADLRGASELALSALAVVPDHALVVEHLTARSTDGLPALRGSAKTQLRGALWLLPLQLGYQFGAARPTIEITHAYGVREISAGHGVAIGGAVFAFTPAGWNCEQVMAELCASVHRQLLRALVKSNVDREAVVLHLAHGIALDRVDLHDARDFTFACFSPRPLDAASLRALFVAKDPVPVIATGERATASLAVIDGSELARVVISCLGDRVRHGAAAMPAAPAVLLSRRAMVAPEPELPPDASEPTAAPDHPLRALVDALTRRLAAIGLHASAWDIVERTTPIVRYDGTIRVAGDNPDLRALAAAQVAGSPWVEAAIDAVVAHIVTVLNVALTEITDTTEAHALVALLADA